MEDWLYYPETCEITFTCDFLVGPRIDQDLCSLPTVSYFDAEYGDWYFDSTDMNEWPPGDYYFWITGTVGALSEGYELHFRLGNHGISWLHCRTRANHQTKVSPEQHHLKREETLV